MTLIYMAEIDPQTRARLLSEEFRTSGIGIRLDEQDYAIHFDPSGIQIAPGDSVLDASEKERAYVTWEEADRRIAHLLDAGQYLPQAVLNLVLDNERSELASGLVDLYVYDPDMLKLIDQTIEKLQHTSDAEFAVLPLVPAWNDLETEDIFNE